MSKIKDTIPEKYVCDNYCEEICFECQYQMETANMKNKPTIEDWYNNKK